MSSDPAINAADRAKHPAWAFVDPPGAAEDIATRAAREALAPLRDVHEAWSAIWRMPPTWDVDGIAHQAINSLLRDLACHLYPAEDDL